MRAAGLDPRKRPDAVIENRVFDVISSRSDTLRNLRSRIAGKVGGRQARRIVVNLQGTTITRAQLERALRDDPITGLQEVITIDQQGRLGHAYP